jgi:hypothetical protein
MPLDTSIPLQIQQPANVLSQYAQAQGVANAINQGKAFDMETERKNTLNSLLSRSYDNQGAREEALMQGGFIDEASKLGKERRENTKLDTENSDKQFDLQKKKLGVLGGVFGRVAQNPSLETANEALDYLSMTGIYPPENIELWRKNAMANPASIKSFAEQAYMSAIDADKQLTAQMTAKRDAESARHNRASEGLTARGQNMTDARERSAMGPGGKPPPGYRWKQDGSLEAIPGGPGDKLPEAQQKQVVGVQNLQRGISEYLKELDGFGRLDIIRPDARAKMGTKYNNMMLQAKEAYNLGVLNGPDFEILQSVITDPRTVKGAITSKDALGTQAKELGRIMSGVEATSSNARPQGKGPSSPGGPSNIDALLDKYK